MNLVKSIISASLMGLASLSFAASAALETPTELVTINDTDVWSNARVGGIYSPHPTKPHDTNKVNWWSVKLACFGHTQGNKCKAEIVADTKGEHPVSLGEVELDLETGDIQPTRIEKDGYVMEVIGKATSRLTKVN